MVKGIQEINPVAGLGGFVPVIGVDLLPQWKKKVVVVEDVVFELCGSFNPGASNIFKINVDTLATEDTTVTATGNFTYGICCDDKYIYYSCTSDYTVKCLRKSDNAVIWTSGTSGTAGSGNNAYAQPLGVGIYEDYIFVADSGNRRIKKINKSDGTFVRHISVSSKGRPYGLTIDPVLGYIYTSIRETTSLIKIAQSGAIISTFATGIVYRSDDMVCHEGYLYLAERSGNYLRKYDLSTGAIEWTVSYSATAYIVSAICAINTGSLCLGLCNSANHPQLVKISTADGSEQGSKVSCGSDQPDFFGNSV